ncbi:hypothetical protein SEA_VANLEE_149 [Gordonia phage VanLee]|uniref:Uncharacterized protein n=1 Tax=Gordonia phage VanLee TaxID=2845816 RepID=A0A8F2D9K3_9CAUD|nr:hypothetical protein QEH49_gp141 [Gordonia phage VanLee]QWS68265.1 hypothetical protein SEA_VANLEE_149 [Gordonia phage VanLee]
MQAATALNRMGIGSTILTTAHLWTPCTVTDYSVTERTVTVAVGEPIVGIKRPVETFDFDEISHIYAGGMYVYVGEVV